MLVQFCTYFRISDHVQKLNCSINRGINGDLQRLPPWDKLGTEHKYLKK